MSAKRVRTALERLASQVAEQQAMPDDSYLAAKDEGLAALRSLQDQHGMLRAALERIALEGMNNPKEDIIGVAVDALSRDEQKL